MKQELSFDQNSSDVFFQESTQDEDLETIVEKCNKGIFQLENNLNEVKQFKLSFNKTLQKVKTVGYSQNNQSYNYQQDMDLDGSLVIDKMKQLSQQETNKHSLTLKTNVDEEDEDQEELKISKVAIGKFLTNVNLNELYLQNFLDMKVYINAGILEYITSINPYQDLLNNFGINKPGHQRLILLQLDEDQGKFERKGLLKCCDQLQQSFPTLEQWLKSIWMEYYQTRFQEAGYENVQNIALIMSSPYKLKEQDIQKELNIQEPEYLLKQLEGICDKFVNFQMNFDLINQGQDGAKDVRCQIPNWNQIQNQCRMF